MEEYMLSSLQRSQRTLTGFHSLQYTDGQSVEDYVVMLRKESVNLPELGADARD